MDLRLKNGAIMQIVGPSGSGKTYFVQDIVCHSDRIFRNKIKNIHWFKGVKNEVGATAATTQQKMMKKVVKYHDNGLTDLKTMKFIKYDVIVLDDLFVEAKNDDNVTNLFTKTARHNDVTLIYITQNMFHAGNSNRTRNLNVHYLVLFRNPRDSLAIEQIGRQMYSGDSEGRQFLKDAFRDATQDKPHGYLFFDFTQECPDFLRIRSNIFAKDNNDGPYVYKQIDK